MDFKTAVSIIINLEGGYVNDPEDKGGETKYGISKHAHPKVDIKNLSLDGAIKIYKDDYWDSNNLMDIPREWRLIFFDAVVNHGARTAKRLLQECLHVKVDGIIGPKTRAAMRDSDPTNFFLKRLAFYASLPSNRFLRGWVKRLLEVITY